MHADDEIQVVTAADAGFAKQLAVLLTTIADVHRDDRVRVWVISPDGRLPCEPPAPADGFAIEVLQPHSAASDWAAPNGHYLPSLSVARLFVATQLPPELSRALYLDADMLVRSSLRPLWESDLEDRALGACRDVVAPWFGVPDLIPWQALGVAPTTPYFNAGMLLIDTGRWRANNVAERCMELLVSGTALKFLDQCALNTVLAGEWTRLSARWNLQAGCFYDSLVWMTEEPESLREAMADPAIVHFNTSRLGRPWQATCTHPFAQEWVAALARTPCHGWLPPKPSLQARIEPALRVAARRVAAAVRR